VPHWAQLLILLFQRLGIASAGRSQPVKVKHSVCTHHIHNAWRHSSIIAMDISGLARSHNPSSAFLSQRALENYRNGHISYDVLIIALTDDLKYSAETPPFHNHQFLSGAKSIAAYGTLSSPSTALLPASCISRISEYPRVKSGLPSYTVNTREDVLPTPRI
jgi:hypothetical protein